jgi:rod shape-determining protein MreB and related proteins
VSESMRVAGNVFDRDIMAYIKAKHNLLIGDRTAEEIKRTIGSAIMPSGDEMPIMEVRGRNLIDGMPKTTEVSTEDVVTALRPSLDKVAVGVRRVLEQAPPELVSDVIERGIVMTGGGAQLRGFDTFVQRVTNIPVAVAPNPEDCVVIGTSAALDMAHLLQDARTRFGSY